MTNEAADILRKAKELIETKGWIQNRLRSVEGFCASGAIQYAAPSLRYSAFGFLYAAIGSPRGKAIPEWNDTPGRTKAEVLSAFDRAIALAEAGK